MAVELMNHLQHVFGQVVCVYCTSAPSKLCSSARASLQQTAPYTPSPARSTVSHVTRARHLALARPDSPWPATGGKTAQGPFGSVQTVVPSHLTHLPDAPPMCLKEREPFETGARMPISGGRGVGRGAGWAR